MGALIHHPDMKCSWGPKACFESPTRAPGSGHRIANETFAKKYVALRDKLHCSDVLHYRAAATLSIAENNAPPAVTLFLKIAIASQKSQALVGGRSARHDLFCKQLSKG